MPDPLRKALAAEIAHLPKNDGRELDDETHGYVEAWAQVARLMAAHPPEPDDLGERVRFECSNDPGLAPFWRRLGDKLRKDEGGLDKPVKNRTAARRLADLLDPPEAPDA